ncbi:hypothetical protein FJZ23_01480 [Candidatus Parcubacteria bacterium]|nr:hypothetical protein [Candidatus Parcubacteria bacterium]
MDFSLHAFAAFLSLLWFLVYWILGGVFFAVVAILRLGRVRKVRFSCLFTLWALAVAVAVAFKGLAYSEREITTCLESAVTKAETVVAVFGCGTAGVFGAFLLGALAITVGGFFIFAISRSQSKPWIVLEQDETSSINPSDPGEARGDEESPGEQSKYF